jgi:hypothetical protein
VSLDRIVRETSDLLRVLEALARVDSSLLSSIRMCGKKYVLGMLIVR